MKAIVILSVLFVFGINVKAETELLKNADFESSSFSGNWHANDCLMTTYTEDKYHGSKCVKITHRYDSVTYRFYVKQKGYYSIVSFLYILHKASRLVWTSANRCCGWRAVVFCKGIHPVTEHAGWRTLRHDRNDGCPDC